MATEHVSDNEFEEKVIQAEGAVLVDFWAEWCGPCKQLSPVLDQVANDYEGQLTVAKVNIDKNPEAPSKYGVRGIPTLILFRDGKQLATKVGSVPKSQLTEWIEENIT